MKTENAIIIILIMIIIVATGIFTLETLTYIPTLEMIIQKFLMTVPILLIPVAPIKLKNHPK